MHPQKIYISSADRCPFSCNTPHHEHVLWTSKCVSPTWITFIVWHICSYLGNVQCEMLLSGRHCYSVCVAVLWLCVLHVCWPLEVPKDISFPCRLVAWSASLNASAQYRNVMLMEHPEGIAIHILLFLYFPAMVPFYKTAMRCILDEPTGTWLARGKRTSVVKVFSLCYAMKACGGSAGIVPLHDIPMT